MSRNLSRQSAVPTPVPIRIPSLCLFSLFYVRVASCRSRAARAWPTAAANRAGSSLSLFSFLFLLFPFYLFFFSSFPFFLLPPPPFSPSRGTSRAARRRPSPPLAVPSCLPSLCSRAPLPASMRACAQAAAEELTRSRALVQHAAARRLAVGRRPSTCATPSPLAVLPCMPHRLTVASAPLRDAEAAPTPLMAA